MPIVIGTSAKAVDSVLAVRDGKITESPQNWIELQSPQQQWST